MNVVVLGATGATGRVLVPELVRRGHTVTALVRDPARAPTGVRVVVGDVRDRTVLGEAVAGADAVVSVLGPRGRDRDLHRTMAENLVTVMAGAGVSRYVGVSGAGMDAPGDRKRRRDRVISFLVQRLAPATVADKAAELAVWRTTDLDWTLVRPPRLNDGPATGRVEHDAHRSTRSTRMSRADLAELLADILEQDLYLRRVPFAASLPPNRTAR